MLIADKSQEKSKDVVSSEPNRQPHKYNTRKLGITKTNPGEKKQSKKERVASDI